MAMLGKAERGKVLLTRLDRIYIKRARRGVVRRGPAVRGGVRQGFS